MEEGRTHMTREYKNVIVLLSLIAVGLLAAACNPDQTSVNTAPRRPSLWGGVQFCATGKWTGGGRMDPPNPDVPDGATGSSTLVGKVTFGFNVFLGSDANGRCIVTKGEIEVNHHPSKTSWHVSVHDGVDAFNEPVFVELISPDGSGRGACIVVGVNPITARVDGQRGTDQVQMELCDNDPGAPQNSRTDAMRWLSANLGDTDLTYLTGGNIVNHGS
jgi:hypothetical protein